MKIKLDEKLQSYMKEKGQKDLVLYVKKGQGCCSAGLRMVQARFSEGEDQVLVEQGYSVAETELGRIFYEPQKIIMEQNPKLIFNRIFGKVVIQPMGMHVNDERFDRACALADMYKEV